MRRISFVIMTLVSWFLLLAWAAGLSWQAPITAAQRTAFQGADFKNVIGSGVIDAARLQVNAVGQEDSTLQSIKLPELKAEEFPVLRYRFANFPRTLELSLIFRRADAPQDVQVISLPWPGEGESAFALNRLPQWHGSIIELGFAQYATPQVVPAGYGFQPFSLTEAQLWSQSWCGDFAVLFTDWFGQWPWSQRSVHALGRDTDIARGQSIVLTMALGVVATVVWAFLLLGLRKSAFISFAIICSLSGWILLDLHWQRGLWWRHQATRDLYAGRAWEERQRLVGDSELLHVAERVLTLLHGEPNTTRILLYTSTGYTAYRLRYHLLPRNVALLAHVPTELRAHLPDASVIIIYGSGDWHYDVATQTLVGGGVAIPGTLLLEEGALLVVRSRRSS